MLPEPPRRQRLGDVLVDWGAIKPEVLEQALQVQRNSPNRQRLGSILLNNHLIDELTLASALAEVHHLRLLNLDGVAIDPSIGRAIPAEVAERLIAIPVSEAAGRFVVAMADPVDVVGADELRMRLRRPIAVVVATPTQIQRKIRELWDESVSASLVESFVDTLSETNAEEEEEEDAGEGAIGIVNQIIGAAAARHASDIHIEPGAENVKVRVRADGIMIEILRLPLASMPPLVSRIKVISGLDVMQRRLPQDGRVRVRSGRRQVDLRVSTMPSIHGESVVMRLLPSQKDLPSMEELGLTWPQVQRLRSELTRTQGFLIVTGPTGSGKSTSIYSMISENIGDDRKTITMENPVEMELAGVVQVHIDEAIGVTFANTLRAALRQDPDVVVVGEARDTETAQMAVSAALTGHLVFTTLHTQDAMSAVDRLVHMGVPRYLVAESVGLVFGQRLLRRPCAFCAVPTPPDDATAKSLGITPEQRSTFLHGKGCHMCNQTGYMGRVGVFEMLDMVEPVREAFLAGDSHKALDIAGEHGFVSLRDTALGMATHGITTIEEVLRATPKRSKLLGRNLD